MTAKSSPEVKREKARLRSERYRRSREILPRRPVLKPWLALGVSRSTYYRRRRKALDQAAARSAAVARQIVLKRCDDFLATLRHELQRASYAQAQGRVGVNLPVLELHPQGGRRSFPGALLRHEPDSCRYDFFAAASIQAPKFSRPFSLTQSYVGYRSESSVLPPSRSMCQFASGLDPITSVLLLESLRL